MTAKIHIECVVEPNFAENAFVVWSQEGGPCWLIDPGLPPSAAGLLRIVERRKLRPEAIVLTHAHPDHFAGVPEVLSALPDLPVYLADGEAKLLTDPWENLSAAMGTPIVVNVAVRHDLAPGATMSMGGTDWQIIDVAGHSPAGRALYCAAAGVVISGDALFAGSIGRTDFPHSNHAQLIRNIREGLLTLPDETVVFSGHGPKTTIGEERRTNPFVGEAAE